jgi:hypothetical protein
MAKSSVAGTAFACFTRSPEGTTPVLPGVPDDWALEKKYAAPPMRRSPPPTPTTTPTIRLVLSLELLLVEDEAGGEDGEGVGEAVAATTTGAAATIGALTYTNAL